MKREFFVSLLLSTSLGWGMPAKTVASDNGGYGWVSAWTASMRIVDGSDLPGSPYGGSDSSVQLENASFRQTFRLTIGADRIRIQLSNLFSDTQLPITAASIALTENNSAGVGQIAAASSKELTFNGSASIVIPPGGAVYSDPLKFGVEALSNIALTIYTKEGQAGGTLTGHPGSRTTSWIESGNKVMEYSVSAKSYIGWLFASAIEAWVPNDYTTIVALGDSITDGRGSETDKNTRWPDFMLERLRNNSINTLAVNNQGSGGNAVLQGGLGPPLLERYKRDALDQKGVRCVFIAEGVNDIGTTSTDEEHQQNVVKGLIEAYSQIAADCKAAGLVTIGATITPFIGHSYGDATREKSRLEVNDWIINNGTFDHVVDFAGLIGEGDHLKAEFDSGDYLHPNVAGYRELANGIPFSVLKACVNN